MNRNLMLGGLALLLLFGCAGQQNYQAPAPPQGSPSGGSQIQVGDSDIAPAPTVNESDTLSNEQVVPPENGTGNASAEGNATANVTAGTLPSDSDLIVENTTNEDLISQQDVVEPP